MCGIGGVFGWAEARGFDATRAGIELSAALAHRGPDGQGTLTDRGLVLVHRRLAIIDPTPAGRQPMTTPDGRYSIVFNGEIYNYRDLRLDLEAGGRPFHDASRHRGAAGAHRARRHRRAEPCSRRCSRSRCGTRRSVR